MGNGKRRKRSYKVSGGIIPAPDLPCLYEDFARRVAKGEDVIPWPFVDCEYLKESGAAVRVKKATKKR